MLSVIEMTTGIGWLNIATFLSSMSTVFVSRFILDLRACAALSVVDLGSTESLALGESISSSLVFAEFSYVTPMEPPDATLDELEDDGDADDDEQP
ncbi:hypothetical protein EVJ58_g8049 [Rhodofomes roseus]|uniref:Uncharacterized protein n=1 Tax=Rhodofomes roseus TaxID=34475 RepID=A0A4Y9XZT5_9APHY|nr:hypothetical protein EVJ58_g8049 [Rhodofomes roseus]